ncbi:hypothetical protein [Ideonella paludis]|uniref:Glycerate kinase n=1 Tax=Ideonella paludis TaxID=1233411 RepID=A0ABS5DRT7_9BURK|nr:hypothetical protein [Ideonella paludis]MBQ0933858.1 hypothetical protein [Ideonella paludis]
MDKRVGWALAVLAVFVGWWQWGGYGVVLALTVVVFWLLLQFYRALRVMQAAGAAPVGHVANAVMLHARLNTGMTLLEILPHTRSLGQKLSDPPNEAFAWTDANGDRVEVTLVHGRLTQWQLIRAAAPEAEAAAGADAAQAPAQPGA